VPTTFLRTFAALVLLVALAGSPAGAQEPDAGGSWSFAPTTAQGGPGRNWFVLDVQPGQVLRESVTLTNPTANPISFRFFATDAINTPNTGDFALKSADEPPTDVGSWVTLAIDAYTTKPGEAVTIPFEIRVPADAAPGDHIGAVAAENVNPESTTASGGINLDIKRVVGSRLYVRVAGPLNPSLRVDEVDVALSQPLLPTGGGRGGTVSYTVANNGNVRLGGTVTVRVTDLFGTTLLERTGLTLPELLPGAAVTFIEAFDGLPPVGPVDAQVVVEAPDGVRATQDGRAWVVPWWALVLMGLVLAGVVVWRHLRKRRSGGASDRGDHGAADAAIDEPDEVPVP
jgi:peptidoglycan hydrolase-like protein with peptidoglycan-binding domain